MVYWICPECGHECSPAIRECPTCTAPPVRPFAATAVNLHPANPEAVKLSLSAFAARRQPQGPVFISYQFKLAGESLSELAIGAIQKSFQEQSAVGLLPAPEEVVTAPAPPLDQWMRQPKLQLTPVPPESAGGATLTAGPQHPTLAGPSLPPELRNFSERQNSNSASNRKRAALPTWLISFLVATVLLLGGGSLLQYLTSDRNASASSAASPTPLASKPALPLPVVEEHPAARSVEVAGVRVVTGANKRPQLQYVVINHSAGELTGLNIRIAVRSVDALAGAPLLSVSTIVPWLGPNQSKEVRADLDPAVKPASVPDWQSLRTEVLIGRQ